MSDEDRHRIIGSLTEEHQAAKREVHLIEERLIRLGRSLHAIAEQLARGDFELASSNLGLFQSDVLDLSAVTRLIREHQEASDRRSRASEKLAALGITFLKD